VLPHSVRHRCIGPGWIFDLAPAPDVRSESRSSWAASGLGGQKKKKKISKILRRKGILKVYGEVSCYTGGNSGGKGHFNVNGSPLAVRNGWPEVGVKDPSGAPVVFCGALKVWEACARALTFSPPCPTKTKTQRQDFYRPSSANDYTGPRRYSAGLFFAVRADPWCARAGLHLEMEGTRTGRPHPAQFSMRRRWLQEALKKESVAAPGRGLSGDSASISPTQTGRRQFPA